MKDQFSELSDKTERAYTAFLKIDRLEHPEPTLSAFRHLPWIMIPFSVIALAGIVLSASRTVFVFYDIALQQFGAVGLLPTTEAITAFIVVDIFFVVSRLVSILLHYKHTGEAKEIGNLVKRGFWIAFGIALIANVYSSVKVLPLLEPIRPWLDLAMGIAVGVSVPTLAFISGDILGILAVNSMAERDASKIVHLQETDEYLQGRERRWATRKREFGLTAKQNIQAPKQAEIDVNLRKLTAIDRPSPQMKKAVEWLRQHPEHMDTESRKLAGMIGVSHTLANDAKRQIKYEQSKGYINGRDTGNVVQ